MKIFLSLVLSIVLMFVLVSCNSPDNESTTPTPSDTPPPTSSDVTASEETPAPTPTPEPPKDVSMTTMDIATELAKKFNGTNIMTMAAEYIGAVEGAAFLIGEVKYEIYRFDDEEKLDQARTGTFTLSIEGFGDYAISSSVNGDFALMCDTPADDVVAAFEALPIG